MFLFDSTLLVDQSLLRFINPSLACLLVAFLCPCRSRLTETWLMSGFLSSIESLPLSRCGEVPFYFSAPPNRDTLLSLLVRRDPAMLATVHMLVPTPCICVSLL